MIAIDINIKDFLLQCLSVLPNMFILFFITFNIGKRIIRDIILDIEIKITSIIFILSLKANKTIKNEKLKSDVILFVVILIIDSKKIEIVIKTKKEIIGYNSVMFSGIRKFCIIIQDITVEKRTDKIIFIKLSFIV